MPAILRDFFTEMPYAAALTNDYLSDRCSSCFEQGNDEWVCSGCEKVVYCGEECMRADRPWHDCECLGFKRNPRPQSTSIDSEIRLLGRLIMRYQIDNGVAILTSEAFPYHLVKNRSLDDLLSHERDFSKKTSFVNLVAKTTSAFRMFFSTTSLAFVKQEVIKRWQCVSSINGFSITSMLVSGSPDTLSYLGEAVYLNASRFDHSCKPNLLFTFTGCRLSVKYVDRQAYDESDEEVRARMTKKQLKKLTFCYGYGTSWNYGTSFSMTKQRIESLKARYFFRCRCSLCSDRVTDLLQMHSSTLACNNCERPYIWRERRWSRGCKLSKICRCPWNAELPDKERWHHDPEAELRAKRLSDQWENIMDSTVKIDDAAKIIEICEPYHMVAAQYWNNSYNARLAQLCEKMFETYCKRLVELKHPELETGIKAVDSQTENSSNIPVKSADTEQMQECVKMMLKMGETMMAVYSRYWEPYNLAMAVLYHRMAALYRLLNEESAAERSSEYYSLAAEVWQMHGKMGCKEYYEKRSAKVLQCPMNIRGSQSKLKQKKNVIK